MRQLEKLRRDYREEEEDEEGEEERQVSNQPAELGRCHCLFDQGVRTLVSCFDMDLCSKGGHFARLVTSCARRGAKRDSPGAGTVPGEEN